MIQNYPHLYKKTSPQYGLVTSKVLIVSYLRHEVETSDHITEIYRHELIVRILA